MRPEARGARRGDAAGTAPRSEQTSAPTATASRRHGGRSRSRLSSSSRAAVSAFETSDPKPYFPISKPLPRERFDLPGAAGQMAGSRQTPGPRPCHLASWRPRCRPRRTRTPGPPPTRCSPAAGHRPPPPTAASFPHSQLPHSLCSPLQLSSSNSHFPHLIPMIPYIL